jgi:hypothetical protein
MKLHENHEQIKDLVGPCLLSLKGTVENNNTNIFIKCPIDRNQP